MKKVLIKNATIFLSFLVLLVSCTEKNYVTQESTLEDNEFKSEFVIPKMIIENGFNINYISFTLNGEENLLNVYNADIFINDEYICNSDVDSDGQILYQRHGTSLKDVFFYDEVRVKLIFKSLVDISWEITDGNVTMDYIESFNYSGQYFSYTPNDKLVVKNTESVTLFNPYTTGNDFVVEKLSLKVPESNHYYNIVIYDEIDILDDLLELLLGDKKSTQINEKSKLYDFSVLSDKDGLIIIDSDLPMFSFLEFSVTDSGTGEVVNELIETEEIIIWEPRLKDYFLNPW